MHIDYILFVMPFLMKRHDKLNMFNAQFYIWIIVQIVDFFVFCSVHLTGGSSAAADCEQKQKELAEISDLLATAEKVFGGTFVQSLAMEERERRETQYIPNGMKFANRDGI